MTLRICWWFALPAVIQIGSASMDPFLGESLLSVDDCKKAKGIVLLDTCAIKAPKDAAWTDAYNTCKAQNSRLLQLPNSTYDEQFTKLAGHALDNFVAVWLGMKRESESAKPFWVQGDGQKSQVTWKSPNEQKFNVSKYPVCGAFFRTTKRQNSWIEPSCDSSISGKCSVWCQHRLSPTLNGTVSSDQSSAISSTSEPATTADKWNQTFAATQSVPDGSKPDKISVAALSDRSTKSTAQVSRESTKGPPSSSSSSSSVKAPPSTAAVKLIESTVVQSKTPTVEDSSSTGDVSTTPMVIKSTESTASDRDITTPAIHRRNQHDPCRDSNCIFGHCIITNSTTAMYHCECTSGFSGNHCQIASGWSSDPIHIYNYVIQDLGNAWVIASSACTFVIYTLLDDSTPEGTLKRHSLIALILEHTLILVFRTPAIVGIGRVACRTMALLMYYVRTAHACLVLFHSYHVYYIMTGVTRGEWGWNGRCFPFIFVAWILIPSALSFFAFLVDPETFGAEFSCMFNWEPTHMSMSFALFAHLVLSLLGVHSLEEAHMHRRWQHKYVGVANVNSMHLRTACVDRLGSMVVAMLAPFGFFVSSMAVYTASPIAFTIAFNTNVILGASMLTTYVVSNTTVWSNVKKVGRKVLVPRFVEE